MKKRMKERLIERPAEAETDRTERPEVEIVIHAGSVEESLRALRHRPAHLIDLSSLPRAYEWTVVPGPETLQ